MNFDETYKNKIIIGSTFKDAPYFSDASIAFSKEILNEYIPTIDKIMKNYPKGFRLLLIIMTQKEGFYKGTRSYTNNNPGNIGNTDNGNNKKLKSLEEGILLQKNFIENILAGKNKSFPINTIVNIKPYFSEEISKNVKTYGISPWLPGYRFLFTGQLDQFIKIYSTGARVSNSYINMIVSFFKNHNLDVKPETKIQDIIKIQ